MVVVVMMIISSFTLHTHLLDGGRMGTVSGSVGHRQVCAYVYTHIPRTVEKPVVPTCLFTYLSIYLPCVCVCVCVRPLHSRFFLGFSVPRAAIETQRLEPYASFAQRSTLSCLVLSCLPFSHLWALPPHVFLRPCATQHQLPFSSIS